MPFFPLDYTALPLRTFGVHFRHTGSGIRVRFYDAQVCPGRRWSPVVKWCLPSFSAARNWGTKV